MGWDADDNVGVGVADGEGVDVGKGEDVNEDVRVEVVVGSWLVAVGVTFVLVGVLEAE